MNHSFLITIISFSTPLSQMVQCIWIANDNNYIFYPKQLMCTRTTLSSEDTVESGETKRFICKRISDESS